MTLIGSANALGDAIPAFNIFKQWPDISFGETDLDDDVAFHRSETAFNNAEIMMDYITHFNLHSWKHHAEVKRRNLVFESWFGCDHKRKNSLLDDDEVNPNELGIDLAARRAVEPKNRVYRLLIMDSFSGHHNLDLYEYCLQFDIILVFLPPHSSHFMQPMDVGVFLHLKNAHQKALRQYTRMGEISITRRQFVAVLHGIFKYAFTRAHGITGFEKTGLFPPNRTIVLDMLEEKKTKFNTVAHPSLLPKVDRWVNAKRGIERINKKLHILSSPTRELWKDIAVVVNEGQITQEHMKEFELDKQARLEALANKKSKRTTVKPSGDIMSSVTVRQLRHAKEIQDAKEQEKQKAK
jgi:hypothetical protein